MKKAWWGVIGGIALLCAVVALGSFLGVKWPENMPSQNSGEPPQSQDLAVEGMSKYTDKDFGFSFWYPSDWKITETPLTSENINSFPGGVVEKWLSVGQPGGVMIAEIYSKYGSITDTGDAGPFGPIKYFFNSQDHAWMVAWPQGGYEGGPASTATTTADVSKNTMGGLHMLGGTSRFDSTVVPLSAHNFLFIHDGGGANARLLTSTITATDASVATPLSGAEQVKVIQAEKDAYAGK
jgi:hypothetical protein